MAKKISGDPKGSALKEVLVSQAFDSEALLNVLERKGIVTRAEVLEENRRLRERKERRLEAAAASESEARGRARS